MFTAVTYNKVGFFDVYIYIYYKYIYIYIYNIIINIVTINYKLMTEAAYNLQRINSM